MKSQTKLTLCAVAFIVLQCAIVVFCADSIRPDPTLTPGVVRTLTQAQVCSTKWGLDRRYVTEAMKVQVAKNYGIDRKTIVARGKGPCCEIDHKVPRELAGADDVKNLWAQPWSSATLKDAEENQYHKDVCSGKISLTAAQLYFMHWGEK